MAIFRFYYQLIRFDVMLINVLATRQGARRIGRRELEGRNNLVTSCQLRLSLRWATLPI